jgi:3-hydroxyisobutyrate dehydrogenase
MWAGAEAGAGTRLKLVANHWVLGLLENLTETVALAEALDVEVDDFLAAIAGGPVDSPYAQFRARPIAAREFGVQFKLKMAEKDARLIQESVASKDVELPLIESIRAQYRRAIGLGFGDQDVSASVMATRGRVKNQT